MITELKEDITHGTREYPYDQYCMQKIGHPFQIPVHWHEEMEIIYVCSGKLHVRIGGQDYDGKSGDFFFVNPRELHLMDSQDLDIKYYTLLFPLTFLSFQTLDELETELLLPLRQGQLLFPVEGQNCACAARLRTLLEEIIGRNGKKERQTMEQERGTLIPLHIRTRILLLQIVQELLEAEALILPAKGSSADRQKELLAYIQEHYMEKITLETLSEQFHLSSKYISRYFKQHFSLSFSSYLMHLRLSQAKHLLEYSQNSVTDVAMLSGFPNVSHFIRTFKAAYGVSPLQYRMSRLS